jgi:hypothetical protein
MIPPDERVLARIGPLRPPEKTGDPEFASLQDSYKNLTLPTNA